VLWLDPIDADLIQLFLHRRSVNRCNGRIVKPLNDGRRRALWKKEGPPDAGIKTGEPLLAGRWQIWQDRRAFRLQHGNRLDGPALYLRNHASVDGAHVVDAARNQILQGR